MLNTGNVAGAYLFGFWHPEQSAIFGRPSHPGKFWSKEKAPMVEHQIRYDDGAAYERYMGNWSRLAGEKFLDWLAPPPGLRWIDVGCGNGAFTELLVELYTPAEVQGIDPSEAQLAFARARPAAGVAEFRQGDAMALPFSEDRFDAAVMALVIFFVRDPAKGVAELVRVACPGGMVATYAWDMLGGGFPLEPIQAEMRAMGLKPVLPPSSGASRMEALRSLWTDAGLDAIETREITVHRTFSDFDDFWTTGLLAASIRPMIAAMASADVELLKTRVRARLPADAAGRITCAARANAVKGRVPT
jgi:SAM-dependent methyltransferase